MTGIYYFRPCWLEEQDWDLEDLPRICPECDREYENDGEAVCPECRAEALNEDTGIDQYYEDSQSPAIED